MNHLDDKEYLELLEQLILKKEEEYGHGWAREWGDIRNLQTQVYDYWYNKKGRDFAMKKIIDSLNK